MKKILCVTFFLLVGIVSVWAQNFITGARVGLNIALTSAGNAGNAVPSIMIGGYAKVMFTGKIGIQPELFYNSIGAKETFPSPFNTVTTKANYLSLPVFFRYNLARKFHLLAGPQFGILLSANSTFVLGTYDIKDQLNSFDFGGVIGAGLDFGPINVGLRYNFGWSNIEKDATYDKTKNKVLQIVAGFKLFGK